MAVGAALVERLEEIEGAILELLAINPAACRAVVDETMLRARVNRQAAEAALNRLLQAGKAEAFRTSDGGEEIRLPL